MTRLLLVVAAALALLCPAGAAHANCETVEQVNYVAGVAVVTLVVECSGTGSTGDPGTTQTSTAVGQAACIAAETVLGPLSQDYCSAPPMPTVTPGLIAAALRRVSLPASKLVVQPPNGRTLVNFATNFYTDTETFTRTITLLGQQVDLRITPATYTWRFGDGTTTSTTTPGAAYPDLQITHDYTTATTVTPAVDTTYTADFRVDNSPWRPVPGTVTIPGATVDLDVVEATPTLVGYR